MSNQENAWEQAYKDNKKKGIEFPSEYIIRMFKGVYPKCDLKKFMGGGIMVSLFWISVVAGLGVT